MRRCERPTALRYVVPLPCGYITMRCERVRELWKCRDDDINVWFWPQKSSTNASQLLMEDLFKRCYRTIPGALIIELRTTCTNSRINAVPMQYPSYAALLPPYSCPVSLQVISRCLPPCFVVRECTMILIPSPSARVLMTLFALISSS